MVRERTPPKKHLRMDVRVKLDGSNIVDISNERVESALTRVADLLNDKFGENVRILFDDNAATRVLYPKGGK